MRARKDVVFSLVCALTLAVDQWTKALARQALQPRGPLRPMVVVDGWFELRYGENPGAAFGTLQDVPVGRLLLALLALAAFVLVLVYLHRTQAESPRLYVALGLLAGGALGNLVDGTRYGRVTDFIVWKFGRHQWPAFNLADAALCIGVGLVVLFLSERDLAARRDA
jgi:signal peptidase II